ncbi:MAG: ribosome small subunit-dependent GTPase A [Simkaniaceae bacterium]|nr:ribosome small subunit-dependent GTPase A [Simkaniaceae bacterium]
MANIDDYLDYEEQFHPKGKRESRKERRETRVRDRSKYKKSDRDQKKRHLKNEEPPLGANDLRGRILTITPDTITVSSGHKTYLCSLKGSLKKEKTKHKNLITVGDWVHFEKKSEGSGTIAHVEKRTSFLIRAENLSRRKQQLIASNIDQVFVVMSVVSPKFKPLLVDRYILSAKKGKMQPIVLINKMDLFNAPPEAISKEELLAEKISFEEFLEAYKPLDIPLIPLSVSTGENLDPLKKLMENKTSVFSGQSGVGKSSLINAVLGSELPTGPIALKTNKGSHTTTIAELIPLKNDGFCIDTPGIKSFGLWENDPSSILEIFPDFTALASDCKFPNCTHTHEPDCAIIKAVKENTIHPLRYASYTTLLEDTPPKEWE